MNKPDVEMVATDKLIPYARNAKKHDEAQVSLLAGSIRQFGFNNPILIAEDNGIVAGHGRVLAAMKLGMAEVPCIRLSHLDENQRRAYILADNRLAELGGGWDLDMLAAEMDALGEVEIDVGELGFDEAFLSLMDLPETESEVDAEAQIDKAEELRVKWGVKPGQLWQLGDHRLICGDCTDKAVVERVMGGEVAGAVVTDPPYGMNLDTKMSSRAGHKDEWEYTPKHYDKVIGDDTDYDPAPIFENWGSCAEIFLWGADYYAELIPARKQGSWLVWDKREGIEDIKFSLSSFELCWSKAKHSREIIRQRWMGLMGTESQDVRSRVHPTQKPIEVFDWIISKYSPAGAIIADPYLGSGTTIIACERLGRKCRAVEISPAYAAVALQRWADATGKTPVLI